MEKSLATRLQADCIAALQAIAEKHNLTVRAHGGTLNDLGAILKFEFKVVGDTLANAEKIEFERYAHLFGLEPTDYGMSFTTGGKTYKLVAFNMKRRKYPIVVEESDGERRLFSDVIVPHIRLSRRKAVAS